MVRRKWHVWALVGLASAVSAAPASYVKRGDWHETFVASWEALAVKAPKERAEAREALWEQVKTDFPGAAPRREMRWTLDDRILDRDWKPGELARRYTQACDAPAVDDLAKARQLYYQARHRRDIAARAQSLDFVALRLAVQDLTDTFGDQYPRGREYLARLEGLQHGPKEHTPGDLERLVADFEALQSEALLANPLLDFDRLLLIRRVPDGDPRREKGRGYSVGEFIGLPRQSSKCTPNIERPFDWDNDIAVLSPVRPDGTLTSLYKSAGRRLMIDLDLHWDGTRMAFSMPGSHKKWQVFELRSATSKGSVRAAGLRQLTPSDQPDVHNYDPCYLPDDRIAFVSTAPLQGVPCNAGVIVGMLYAMNADGTGIHQLAFEQDHDYSPSVTNDGRLLYLRWDYTDLPHVWNRLLFTMNPDGSCQKEHYGTNSYWPNAIFFARSVPDHPTRLVGIVTGHHVGRVGDLVVFDPALGHHEADGVVQQVPGRGKTVEPVIEDRLTEHTFPKFLHPWPLSSKHFLVSCKPTPDALWGIYLADVFDNLVLIKEQERHVLVEPAPLRARSRPPVVPPRTLPRRKDALVSITDIYRGPGLRDVPRGSVKRLRVFTYHFGYQRIAGIDHRVGADGPWEVKRVLGTVPVEADGSAYFRIPARTPISVQPLDAQGHALQLMRSWMTAMPGEVLSCVGCHESQNSAPPNRTTLAMGRGPSALEPWYGPVRGFSFQREVQPVLDKYCVGCHSPTRLPNGAGGHPPDLRRDQNAVYAYRHGDPELKLLRDTPIQELMPKFRGLFPPSYIALRSFVRVGGLESDLHLQPPKEFHAETSELFQMLRKGHYNVQLDAEAWDRLATWLDLNAPCHGTWSEFTRIAGDQRKRRLALRALYGGVAEDHEDIPSIDRPPAAFVKPQPSLEPAPRPVEFPGWPLDPSEARRRQAELPGRAIDLGDRLTLELVPIPAGSFGMGATDGHRDERPPRRVDIGEPFLIGKFEVTNEQYRRFDPHHDSRFEHRTSWIFEEEYLGWLLNHPKQPVVRVSWEQAMAFCRWLSGRTGLTFSLPTEAQWEYACRSGTATPLSYGDLDTGFSKHANMADHTIRDLAYDAWRPLPPDIAPRDARFNDGKLVTADVGSYQPNAWGLHDMHGNAWEWTRSEYRPYPYRPDDGRNDETKSLRRVVRGGSWYDRPKRCRSAFRLSYPQYQRVFNVGFRVVARID